MENALSALKARYLMLHLRSAVSHVVLMKSTISTNSAVNVPGTPLTSLVNALPVLETPPMTLLQSLVHVLTATLNVETSVSLAVVSMKSFPTANAAA